MVLELLFLIVWCDCCDCDWILCVLLLNVGRLVFHTITTNWTCAVLGPWQTLILVLLVLSLIQAAIVPKWLPFCPFGCSSAMNTSIEEIHSCTNEEASYYSTDRKIDRISSSVCSEFCEHHDSMSVSVEGNHSNRLETLSDVARNYHHR